MEGNDDRSEIANWEESDTKELDTDVVTDEEKEVAGPGEVYCTSCGRTIKEAAEVCPHCGVRQHGTDSSDQSEAKRELSERRQYELEKNASKSRVLAVLLGFFFPPLGYLYVGKWGWALVNVLTFNYLLLFGFILVPLHVLKIISDAKSELRMAGVGGY